MSDKEVSGAGPASRDDRAAVIIRVRFCNKDDFDVVWVEGQRVRDLKRLVKDKFPDLEANYIWDEVKFVYMSNIKKRVPEKVIKKLMDEEYDVNVPDDKTVEGLTLCLLDGGKPISYYSSSGKGPDLPGDGSKLILHGDEDADHGVYIYAPLTAEAAAVQKAKQAEADAGAAVRKATKDVDDAAPDTKPAAQQALSLAEARHSLTKAEHSLTKAEHKEALARARVAAAVKALSLPHTSLNQEAASKEKDAADAALAMATIEVGKAQDYIRTLVFSQSTAAEEQDTVSDLPVFPKKTIVCADPQAASKFASSSGMLPINAGMFFSTTFKWIGSEAYDNALQKAKSAADDLKASLCRRLWPSVTARADLLYVGEKESPAAWHVQKDFLPKVELLFSSKSSKFVPAGTVTLESLGAADGLATKDSLMDMYIESHGNVRGVLEAKGTAASLEGAMRQAFACGSNIALYHRKLGVAAADICVPIIACTGRFVQFGCVRMLEPEFPYLVITSKVIDMFEANDIILAVEHFLAVEHITSLPLSLTKTANKTLTKLQIDKDELYHFKSLAAFFAVYGNNDLPSFHASLSRFGRIIERLHACSRLDSLCLPITLFHAAVITDYGCFVFHKLGDYRIGLPKDLDLAKKIVAEVRAVVSAVHKECNVVHMDLYPSNIMWRVDERGNVHIKIIDWDAAHVIGEGFSEEVKSRTENFASSRLKFTTPFLADINYDLFYLDALEFALKEEDRFKMLISSEKADLDAEFPQLCAEYSASEEFKKRMEEVVQERISKLHVIE